MVEQLLSELKLDRRGRFLLVLVDRVDLVQSNIPPLLRLKLLGGEWSIDRDDLHQISIFVYLDKAFFPQLFEGVGVLHRLIEICFQGHQLLERLTFESVQLFLIDFNPWNSLVVSGFQALVSDELVW